MLRTSVIIRPTRRCALEPLMSQNTEFSVQHARRYDQRNTLRWLFSHVWRYKLFAFVTMSCYILAWLVFAGAPLMIGRAAQEIIQPTAQDGLLWIALTILGMLVADGLFMLTGSLSAEHIAAKIAADAREELYASLLGKSQAFHDRQRVGDIMARATDDMNQLSSMIMPGASIGFEMLMGVIVPLIYMASLNINLLIVPLAFIVSYVILVRRYMRRLMPISRGQREQL